MLYDLAILGGGPAGAAAGVYASRKKLKTVLITDEFGGQSTVSPDVQNWVGTVSITGSKLGEILKKHVEAYAGDTLEIKEGERISKVTPIPATQDGQAKSNSHFSIETESKNMFESKSVLVATGAHRRKLGVPGADMFENKGLTYCATCDGPLFADQDVAVIGGGNAGFETAAQLLAYTKSVTLLQRSDVYRADPVTVEKVLADPKMTGLLNAQIKEVKGDKFVNGLVYTDKDGKDNMLDVTGVFVEIGLIPTTGFVDGLVELDEYKRIVIDPWTQRASADGIWAAGDCSNVRFHQNNIAAGDAVKALEDVYLYLRTR